MKIIQFTKYKLCDLLKNKNNVRRKNLKNLNHYEKKKSAHIDN